MAIEYLKSAMAQRACLELRPEYWPQTMRSLTRRLFLASASATPFLSPQVVSPKVALSKPWDAPPFPLWSAEFMDKLLTDSPWAKPSTVRVKLDAIQRLVEPSASYLQIGLPGGIGFPRTGSGIPGVGWPRGGSTTGTRLPPGSGPTTGGGAKTGATAEIFLTTRWASALPIRRVQALQRFGRDGLESPEAIELLDTQRAEYVLEIAGFPTTIVPQGAERLAADLTDSARLSVPGRRPITAASCNVPEHGMHLMATLSFPRFENLHPEEGYIELSAKFRGVETRERFKLKEMVYSGNLEL